MTAWQVLAKTYGRIMNKRKVVDVDEEAKVVLFKDGDGGFYAIDTDRADQPKYLGEELGRAELRFSSYKTAGTVWPCSASRGAAGTYCNLYKAAHL